MFSQLSSLVPSLKSYTRQSKEHTVNIAPAEIYDVETAREKSARALKHLLKLNHANFSLLYNGLMLYNHIPHLLSTAYLFGADHEHLNRLYESESAELEPWADSPGEIGDDDWRDFLGKRDYQRAFLDFFEDEVVRCGYDWKGVLEKYLFSRKTPLINCAVSGFGHPLLHLGYAYEMNSREVAMEALSMIAACYSNTHEYLDDPTYLQSASMYKTNSLLEIIGQVRSDRSLNGAFEEASASNFGKLLETHESLLLQHWAAWDITDATEQFEDIQRLATALLVNSGGKSHDFFFVQLLTTTHAIRVILPVIPAQYHISLLRQWWLLALGVYIAELRPEVSASSVDEIENYDLGGRDWAWVTQHALRDTAPISMHYTKSLRTLIEAGKTWKYHDGYYLRAAVKFIDEFKGWSGLD
ncbi:hypothetical protein LOZ39_003550 [Ophidiomyces ophidiicola]|uniref:Uncharacterized protein n=1 Tax=Ophidiomyces ophidiicola TaxID=1387563 RepID=A0ACB8USG1_9EURO|nr:uncharacterized protein LOZ57_003664 [Ophidiomyces ophidiicola]KAI1917093.1 hypothetical protein LOZ61_000610 [Ophidiomyces ophidiicola]KAI1922642.1 hypothetical protein LOZ64_001200 [Ophidiomyces ophidiicola]KAI1927682.1 hypothetical protein LOZ60_002941 [Ophidiomyces ophidiicola]KAI1946409.1 hypothetical protein LOZ57_003664 [Ophidiomyces ophidiicola]KAI1949953.1 hypothetical protein LOZ62_002123 [Ophidiomyces ophidiicola]